MGMRAKAAGVLVLVVGTVLTGVAMAAPPKKKEKITPEYESDEDIQVSTEDGTTTVVMDEETASSGVEEILPEVEIDIKPAQDIVYDKDDTEEVISDVVDTAIKNVDNGADQTPVDEKLQQIAKQEGKSEKEAVSEVVKEIIQGQTPTNLAITETAAELDPDGTVSLARLLLVRETLPGWKEDLQQDIREWQEKTGDLIVDGKFGIVSAARMALEVGILPLVRFFPKTVYTKAQAKAAYDERIISSINMLKESLPDSQAQIDGLVMSMGREKAQAFGNANPPVQDTLTFIQDVNDAIAEAAEKVTEKELS